MIKQLPPSVAVILGLIVGLVIGAGGTGTAVYFYMKENVRADMAEVELETVIDGELKANVIRQNKENQVKESARYKESIESGKKRVTDDSGRYVSDDAFSRLQSKRCKALSLPDCAN